MSAEDVRAEWWATEKVRRKFGTDVPHEPTDEFIRHAFAEGARSLWPDGRDPGWHITFDRWLAEYVATKQAEALREAAQAFTDNRMPSVAGVRDRVARILRFRADRIAP